MIFFVVDAANARGSAAGHPSRDGATTGAHSSAGAPAQGGDFPGHARCAMRPDAGHPNSVTKGGGPTMVAEVGWASALPTQL